MVVDEGSWNSASQGVAAEEDNNHVNPSEHEESGKGKSGNIGTVPDSVINVPEASTCVDTIMEWRASGYKGNSSQELISLFEGNKEEASLKMIGDNALKCILVIYLYGRYLLITMLNLYN